MAEGKISVHNYPAKRSPVLSPEFVKRLSGEATVDEGETVRFDCKVVAFPKPTVKWFKDDEPVTEHSRINVEANENGEFSLVIEKITKTDEAAYRCKAENPEGSSSSTIYLAVKAKSKSPKKTPPRVSSFPSAFPPIKEFIKEEEQEAEITRCQPESPLTPLYYGVTIKDRSWPEFLGSWAFVNGVNTNDFAYADDDEDEDVFLSEDFAHGNGDTSSFQNNGHSDSDSENDVSDLLNRNLIFENKNLITTEIANKIESKFVINAVVLKDENANQAPISTATNSDGATETLDSSHDLAEDGPTQSDKTKSGNGPDLSSYSCDNSSETTEQSVNTEMSNVSRDVSIIADNSTDLQNSSEIDQICEKQYVPFCVHSFNSDDDDDNMQELAWKKGLFFVLTGYTFLALSLGFTPETFVFLILIGQLMFLIIRYLLKDV